MRGRQVTSQCGVSRSAACPEGLPGMIVYCRTAPSTTLPGDLATAAKSCTATARLDMARCPKLMMLLTGRPSCKPPCLAEALLCSACQAVLHQCTPLRVHAGLHVREAAAAAAWPAAQTSCGCHYVYVSRLLRGATCRRCTAVAHLECQGGAHGQHRDLHRHGPQSGPPRSTERSQAPRSIARAEQCKDQEDDSGGLSPTKPR